MPKNQDKTCLRKSGGDKELIIKRLKEDRTIKLIISVRGSFFLMKFLLESLYPPFRLNQPEFLLKFEIHTL